MLEIGTGSYQAAVLAEMGIEVYTVEVIAELAATAAPRLERLGYQQVHMLEADGYFGWDEYAPYDAIIVTAAPDHLPQPLLGQLVEGGRLVIPVGPGRFFPDDVAFSPTSNRTRSWQRTWAMCHSCRSPGRHLRGRSRRQTPFCVGKPVSSPGFPTQNAPDRRRGEGDPEENL